MKFEIKMHPVVAYIWIALIFSLTLAMVPFFLIGWISEIYIIAINSVRDVMLEKIDEIERRAT